IYLTTYFLAQFFPPGRTSKLRNDTLMFQQHQGESLSKAWTYFKDLLQKVLHHGIDLWLQVQIFYNHLNPATRRTIDQSSGGLVSNFMASQDARLSKFEAGFKQKQSEMTNKIDTFLKAINDQMKRALPSDTVKNPKLNVNSTSLVLSACSYPMEDPQSLSRPLNSINAIKICFKQTNNFQKDKPQIKTLTINEIGTPKIKEPECILEDEFKDLHLNLPVLEVQAHAPMYNAILDKYVESLKQGKKGFAFI
ncbi:MAK10-like protein, partial [Tanacetum coccineum]